MGKTTLLIAVSLVLFLAVAGAALQSLLVTQRVAAVTDVQGDVRLQSSGSKASYPIGKAKCVRAGDMLKTGDGGATLNWVSGTRIRLDPSTKLEVVESEYNAATRASTTRFLLDVGQVWVRVRRLRSRRSTFRIVTPTCIASARGTLFSVKVDASGETDISVCQGTVKVTKGSEHQTVQQGRKTRVLPGQYASWADMNMADLSMADDLAWDAAKDVRRPYLRIDDPSGNRAAVKGGTIRVAGTTERGVKVTIGGQPARVRRNGTFSLLRPAHPGDVIDLVVTATDEDGGCTVQKMTVKAVSPGGMPG